MKQHTILSFGTRKSKRSLEWNIPNSCFSWIVYLKLHARGKMVQQRHEKIVFCIKTNCENMIIKKNYNVMSKNVGSSWKPFLEETPSGPQHFKTQKISDFPSPTIWNRDYVVRNIFNSCHVQAYFLISLKNYFEVDKIIVAE